jgi:hypothetical protein
VCFKKEAISPTQVELTCDDSNISITAPVAGSIFLVGDAAPNEPSKNLSRSRAYSAAVCRLYAFLFPRFRRLLLAKSFVTRMWP